MSARDDREFPGFTNVYADIGEADLVLEPAAQAREGDSDSTLACAAGSQVLNRRQFLGATTIAALAAASGCRRPDLKILPYAQTSEHTTPGLPTFYATSMPKPGGCFPILVETHEGRPTKIEGHPTHPASMGGCDVFTQASIYDLYSPDRSKEVLKRNAEGKLVPSTWEAFDAFAATHFAELKKKEGEGLAFLLEDNPSPALRLLREYMKERFPKAVWCVFEPISNANALAGSQIAFDYTETKKVDDKEEKIRKPLVASYDFSKAKRILSLDCDFLGIEGSMVLNARQFAEGRRKHGDEMNRLYVVESTYTVTGTMADHRLRLPSSAIADYAIALLKEIVSRKEISISPGLKSAIERASYLGSGIPSEWYVEVVSDLLKFKGKSLVIPSDRHPPFVHALASLINQLLNNNGETVRHRPATNDANISINDLEELVSAKQLTTLVMLGGDPAAGHGPGQRDFSTKVRELPAVIHLGEFVNGTSYDANWHLPKTHYLESWSDAESEDGTYCCIQPVIAPLHGGRSALEFLIHISGWEKAASYSDAKARQFQLFQEAFKKRTGTENELAFKRFIQEGYVRESARPFVQASLNEGALVQSIRTPLSTPIPNEKYELCYRADYRMYDGRFAWNAWLMELPDPITKLVWDNAALFSPKTAESLKLKNGDVVSIGDHAAGLAVPVFVLPGHADESITLHLGYGKLRLSNADEGGGFWTNWLRRRDRYFDIVTVSKPVRTYDLVTTQEHGTIPADKKHEIIREHSIHDHSKHEHQHDDPKSRFQWGYDQSKYKDAGGDTRRVALQQAQDVAVPQALDGDMQWGMVIDLNTCTGCSACVIACQAENNIPVVGKQEVKNNREMHWISVHRYFTSTKGEVRGGLEQSPADDSGIVSQPMMCQHCEAAPCESVCPVNAAVHSPEGLNLQVYNRCIGTRYCSNNCPYKARKFNWFDFNKRRLDELRVPTPFSEAGMPETLKMQKNPEVTVRMRGVMEKCTYCIQRIERARIGAKVLAIKAGADKPDAVAPANPYEAGYDIQIIDGIPRILVPDGIIKTACEQACPSQAITFGNVRDKNSRVYKLKNTGHDYLVLGSINTKPRTSYLPRLRNPNPKMLREGDGA